MTGHVRRRGERSFELKFDCGTDPLTGKRRSRYASFKGTKRAAEIELARLISEHAAGNGIDPTKATVGEFLTTWLADWAKQNVSPLSFHNRDVKNPRFMGVCTVRNKSNRFFTHPDEVTPCPYRQCGCAGRSIGSCSGAGADPR
jgi:hypothetical protein